MQFSLGGTPCILQGLRQGSRVNLEGGGDAFKLPKMEHKGLLLQLVGRPLPEAQEVRVTQAQQLGLRTE
jgi:hypothetical protein